MAEQLDSRLVEIINGKPMQRYSTKMVVAEAARLRTYWSERDNHIKDVWSVLDLKDRNIKQGYESLVDNEPKVMFDMAVHLMTDLPHRTQVMIPSTDVDLRRKAGVCENAIQSIWRKEADITQGNDPFDIEYTTYMLASGWRSFRYWLDPNASDGLPFKVVVDNPLEAYPWYANGKLVEYAHIYNMNGAEFQAMARSRGVFTFNNLFKDYNYCVVDLYHLVDDGNEPYVVNTVVYHGQPQGTTLDPVYPTADGGYLEMPNILPAQTEIPAVCSPVNGFPDRTRGGWQYRVGSTLLDSNMAIYKNQDRYLSYRVQQYKEYTRPWRVFRNIQPPDKVDENQGEDWRERSDKDVFVKDANTGQAEVSILQGEVDPVVIAQLRQELKEMTQRGVFNYSIFGTMGTELSGFAISQLFAQVKYKLSRYQKAKNQDMRKLEMQWLKWYKESKDVKFNISGFETGDNGVRIPVERELKKEDVPETFDLIVSQPLSLPNAMQQKLAAARMAVPGNQRLLDMPTILEKVLEFDDVQGIMDGVEQDLTAVDEVDIAVGRIMKFEVKLKEAKEDPTKVKLLSLIHI